MERREAPGAINGRPFGGPLSGARQHAVDGGVRPSNSEGLRLAALHRDARYGGRRSASVFRIASTASPEASTDA